MAADMGLQKRKVVTGCLNTKKGTHHDSPQLIVTTPLRLSYVEMGFPVTDTGVYYIHNALSAMEPDIWVAAARVEVKIDKGSFAEPS